MTEKNITVLVHTNTGIFFGVITVPSEIRFFDFVNLSAEFLHLIGREAVDESKATKDLNELHINKKAIKVLTTVVEDEGKGTAVSRRIYRFVQKKPVSVNIKMTDYEISGKLHSLEEGSVTGIIEKNVPFLACTDVNIHNTLTNKSWSATFAAINRNNISVLEKVDIRL